MSRMISFTDKEIELMIDALLEGQAGSTTGSRYKRLIDKIQKPHKRITVQSAKAKGRNLQKWALRMIANLLRYDLPEDKDLSLIRSREMGQSGTDIVINKSLRDRFPFAVECKNQEQISLPAFVEQARSNTSSSLPYLMVILKNKSLKNPLICMEQEGLSYLYDALYNKGQGNKGES